MSKNKRVKKCTFSEAPNWKRKKDVAKFEQKRRENKLEANYYKTTSAIADALFPHFRW